MMEFAFEQSPWEAALEAAAPGTSFPAVQFLTLTEGEDEDVLEEAFRILEEKHITLDLTALPAPVLQGASAVRLRQEQQLVLQEDLLTGLEENDPLRLYLEELAAIPAAGDVRLLAEQYLSGDEAVSCRLADLSLSKVVDLACGMTGRGVLLLDLIQEGSLGLWQGILSYTGGDFEQHCNWWIQQYLNKAVVLQARTGGTGQKLRQGMADYRDTDQRLLVELGRNPTVEEIAQQMHIQPQEAAVYADLLHSASTRTGSDKEPELPEEEEQAVENTAYFQMRQRITELLSALDEQAAKLLTLRFGLEGGLPLSPEETGKQLDMTPEEVIAAEAAALGILRQDHER